MSYLPPRGYRRVLVLSAYLLLGTAACLLFLKTLLLPLLPFLIAWVTAMLLSPAVRSICRHTRMPKKAVSFLCVLLVFLTVFGLLAAVCGRVISEMKELASHLMSDAADTVGEAFDSLEGFLEKLPFFDRIENPETAEQIKKGLIAVISEAVSSFSSHLPEAAMKLFSSLPGILLFAVTLVLSTFYMGTDVSKINASIAELLPEQARLRLFDAKKKLMSAGVKYVKAYLMILFITFVQLLIGFLFLKIPYALTLAAVIALIDILPVFGVGTVLLPWAALLLLKKDFHTGIGLLIVFGVIWVVRQILEPKIVGQSIGLPPLLTLMAMYTGYRILGFPGLFVFPFVFILVKNLIDIGLIPFGKAKTEEHRAPSSPTEPHSRSEQPPS